MNRKLDRLQREISAAYREYQTLGMWPESTNKFCFMRRDIAIKKYHYLMAVLCYEQAKEFYSVDVPGQRGHDADVGST